MDVQETIAEVARAMDAWKSAGGLLEDIGWPRSVEEEFFARGARELPRVTYEVDRGSLAEEEKALRALETNIEGEGPVFDWLRSHVRSRADRARLLAAVGTKAFGTVSHEVYGGTKSPFVGGAQTNADLAKHILARLEIHGWDEHRMDDSTVSAEELAASLTARIDKRKLPIKVELDEACTSKAIASGKRVRVRPDATFTSWEAEGLYRHEVETHALSALNGAAQEKVPILRSGGPRSTRTQEGLAVFAELYHHAMPIARLRRLAVRVEIVEMAEEGASFLDVFHHLVKEHGWDPRDAYFDAARVFRGGPPAGGGPFTKDATYLAGLTTVYTFLAAFVRGGFRDECEMLVCGRFALEDFAALFELRQRGVLARPKYLPRWLRDWSTLLPYFAFTSFLDGIDLEPIEKQFERAIEIAEAATGA